MSYKINIYDLLSRPIIRSDKMFEWENKLTDIELEECEKEMFEMVKSRNKISDNIGAELLSAYIDRDILYKCLQLS